jgi:hypothetical protein
MSVSLHQRSNREVLGGLGRQLYCIDDPAAIRRALAAEHIRAATYSASGYGDADEFSALHTTRLMTILHHNLDGLWPVPTPESAAHRTGAPREESYRPILDDLKNIADVADLGGGFWVATPLRLVEMSDPEWLLVIGGAPARAIETAFEARVESAAAGRFVRRTQINRSALECLQSVDIWLGSPEPLQEWTRRVVSAHERRLSNPEETSADALEIYVPDFFRDQRKQGRWMRAADIHQPFAELRLCRPRASFASGWDRPYYLGLFGYRQGGLTLKRSAQVSYDLTRRLRFGLDEQLQVPRSAIIRRDGDTCTLDLAYPLPEPESRILSLSWPAPDGKEQTYRFHAAALPALVDVFRSLSIEPTISRGRA